MSPYRVIFSDIDGTLLDSRHQLPPATAARIRELDRLGIPFILMSSRPPQGIFPIQEQLGIRAPLVAFGGALILDKNRRPLWNVCLPADKARAVREAAAIRWPSVCCTLYTADHWIVEDLRNPWVLLEQRIGAVDPLAADMPEDGIYKLLCMGEESAIQEMPAALGQQFPDLYIHPSKATYLEVMDAAASKGKALCRLCTLMGTAPSDAIAFGDNFNDADMLEAAGLGVAMGNAPAGLQALAGRTTADNDHEGLRLVLDELFPHGE